VGCCAVVTKDRRDERQRRNGAGTRVGELVPKGARGRGRAAANRRRTWAACWGVASPGFLVARHDIGAGRGQRQLGRKQGRHSGER
jgi:hypothetical protein